MNHSLAIVASSSTGNVYLLSVTQSPATLPPVTSTIKSYLLQADSSGNVQAANATTVPNAPISGTPNQYCHACFGPPISTLSSGVVSITIDGTVVFNQLGPSDGWSSWNVIDGTTTPISAVATDQIRGSGFLFAGVYVTTGLGEVYASICDPSSSSGLSELDFGGVGVLTSGPAGPLGVLGIDPRDRYGGDDPAAILVTFFGSTGSDPFSSTPSPASATSFEWQASTVSPPPAAVLDGGSQGAGVVDGLVVNGNPGGTPQAIFLDSNGIPFLLYGISPSDWAVYGQNGGRLTLPEGQQPQSPQFAMIAAGPGRSIGYNVPSLYVGFLDTSGNPWYTSQDANGAWIPYPNYLPEDFPNQANTQKMLPIIDFVMGGGFGACVGFDQNIYVIAQDQNGSWQSWTEIGSA